MYEIVNVQYTGTYNNGGTSIPAVLGEFRASSAADLPAQNVDCHIICGCDGLDIATGDRYIWNGTAWILQPKDNAFTNVYTKAEIDNMSNVIYQTMLYYHTAQESSDGSITFYTLGTPVSSLTIYGNGQQTGTPTPDNPVMPTFCGVRTVNVCQPAAAETKTNNGITAVSNGSGTYHVSGTATADADIRFDVPSFLIPISIAGGGSGTYSMFNSAEYNNVYVKIVFYYRGTKVDDWGLISLNRNDTNYQLMGGKDCDAIGFTVKSGVTVDFTISPEFTDDGVLPSGFEPFGWAVKLTCAGQTVPVYLGEVPTVRRVKKLVLDGTENWIYRSGEPQNVYFLEFAGLVVVSNSGLCTHYQNQDSGSFSTLADKHVLNCLSPDSSKAYIAIRDSSFSLLSDFKAFLAAQYAAGTPVTIWYVLATPETAIVNEPLAKIGTYADELHSEDAGVSIPTVKGSNTLTVETELQPSLIEISGGYHA